MLNARLRGPRACSLQGLLPLGAPLGLRLLSVGVPGRCKPAAWQFRLCLCWGPVGFTSSGPWIMVLFLYVTGDFSQS